MRTLILMLVSLSIINSIDAQSLPKTDTFYSEFAVDIDTFSVSGLLSFAYDGEIKKGAYIHPELLGVYIDYCYSNFPSDFLCALSSSSIEAILIDSLFIATRNLSAESIHWWVTVRDFNLDGVPDIGLTHDLGIRNTSSEVWVNIKGKFYRWYGLSGQPIWDRDEKKRMLQTGWYMGGGQETTQWYKIDGDTTMIPVPR